MTVRTWLRFYLLFSQQSNGHHAPVNLLVLTGNRYVQNKSVPVASSHVGRGVNPCFAGGWRATVAQGNRTPMNAESYPRWTGAGVQEAWMSMLKDSRRANTPQNKTKSNRTSNWTLWKTQQHRVGNHTFAISAGYNSILPGSELGTKRWNSGCHNPTRNEDNIRSDFCAAYTAKHLVTS